MSGVVALIVGAVLFQRDRKAMYWFSLMMLMSALWAISYSLELASPNMEQMLAWINVEYLGISFLPALWMIFVVHYIDHSEWLTRRNLGLLFSFPIIALILVWTNPWHRIHYESFTVDTSGPFPLLSFQPGPWYHVHTAYFYVILFSGFFLLYRHYRHCAESYRKQVRIVLFGALIPWATNLAYLLGLRPHQHIDMTPYAFILTALVIAYGLHKHQLFDVVPFAREKLIESLREGVVVLDIEGRIVDINDAAKKLVSARNEDGMGKGFKDWWPQGRELTRQLESKEDGSCEMSMILGGSERVYEISMTSLKDEKRSEVGRLILFVDITDRKRVTEALQLQATELKALNDLKTRMFSIIAHDLRSPLVSLIGILNLAQSTHFSERELKEILATLSKDVGYTTELLDNLLSWSKSQLEGERLDVTDIDLKSLVVDKVEYFRERAREKGVRLEDKVPSQTYVHADRRMMDAVLRNLLSNALKFCRDGDCISIEASRDDLKTTVFVRDTGVGMDAGTLSGLFGFGSVTKPGTRNERGTGLGLKLCRDFIERNRGRITAESELGKGSCFMVELPRN